MQHALHPPIAGLSANLECHRSLYYRTEFTVESHIHLDFGLTAREPRFNQSGTLFEKIKIWGDRPSILSQIL